MVYRRIYIGVAVICLAVTAYADDLYRVTVADRQDAAILRSTGVKGVVRLADGFLVLADSASASHLAMTGLPVQLVLASVKQDELGLDIEHRLAVSGSSTAAERQEEVRVVRIPPEGPWRMTAAGVSVLRLADEHVEIEFLESRYTADAMLARLGQSTIPLEELIGRVSKDSLESYEQMLATCNPRYPGTPTNDSARNWLAAKLASFGVDSISVDSFGSINEFGPLPGFNVVGYKFGHRFPKHFVVVGAHRDARDAIPASGQISPGADDNGSGTVAVLEMARVLAGVETDMTFVFALFDAEEQGCFGSKLYSRGARARGDSIVCMMNLDMVGNINNNSAVRVYRGQQTGVSELFAVLADSLFRTTTTFEGQTNGSDHFPFDQAGYETAYIEEFNISPMYHSMQDDTTYISWDYLTMITQASLATIYTVNATAWPKPTLAFRFPYGLPQVITPGKTTSFEVSIIPVSGGVRVAGSERLCYSVADSTCQVVSLQQVSDLTFRATLPATGCGTRLRYYIKADEEAQGTLADTDSTIGHFALSASHSETVFADNFETDRGWEVTGSAVNSHEGRWERGYPAASGSMNDPIQDFDKSGQYYVTGNGYYYKWSQLIGDNTYLTSPSIDFAGKSAVVTCAIWYSNEPHIYQEYFANHQDTFKVKISFDGGNCILQKLIGPVEHADGGWFTYSFSLGSMHASSVRIQFAAEDIGARSCQEAAVDAFEIITYDCIVPPSCCTGLAGNVNVTGVVDLADLSALVSYLTGGGYTLPCSDAANVNGFGIVDLGDLSALVSYLTGAGYVLPNCS